jgi:hypothetical protein
MDDRLPVYMETDSRPVTYNLGRDPASRVSQTGPAQRKGTLFTAERVIQS